IAVSNGIDALAVLKSEIPDIILLDIMLPFPLDGFSILRILKNDVKLAAIPVVLMSAINSDDKISMGLEMGANDYIV
ncbi:response regulator, partial [Vibrio parahaemolyticus]